MKTFLRGAMTLTVLGSPLWANSGTTSDWLGLDEELNSLASAVSLQGDEPRFGALLRTYLAQTGDFNDPLSGGSGEDILGVKLQDAKLWANGDLGEFGWRIMFDFANNSSGLFNDETFWLANLNDSLSSGSLEAALQDAYATWNINEYLDLTLGRFRAPTTRSMWVASDQLLFLHRTAIGELGYFFHEGVMLSGEYESNFRWWASAQNGLDGTEDDLRWNGRAEYTFTGQDAPFQEGAWVHTDEAETTVGVFIGDEGEADDGLYLGGDVTANFGQFSFYGEVVDFDDSWGGILGDFYFGDPLAYDSSGATPWSATVSYMLSPEEWEAAVRYEEFDDLNDSNAVSLGVNYYMQGHNAKWQLNWVNVSSDANQFEGSLLALGLTLGLEGYDA